jgi:hypothetical protein
VGPLDVWSQSATPIANAPPSTLDNVTVTRVRRSGNKDHKRVNIFI